MLDLDHTKPLQSPPIEIQSLAFRINATTDGDDRKKVDLVQYTPKRDKGPKFSPEMISSIGSPERLQRQTAIFRRIQFKNATNKFRRKRAAQQFYHIVVELWAELSGEVSVKIASQYSGRIVVRGRSPVHYNQQDKRKKL